MRLANSTVSKRRGLVALLSAFVLAGYAEAQALTSERPEDVSPECMEVLVESAEPDSLEMACTEYVEGYSAEESSELRDMHADEVESDSEEINGAGHMSAEHWRPAYRHIMVAPELPDSADVTMYGKRAFWRAGAEVVGFNLGLWSFDRFVLNGHYAYISWNSIKENFRHGFEWDDDHLHTNMFDHPYNGSIFYNAGRSNGFNYWQSELFAIGGSAMWEMFMECEYPSTNDIIATPIGGAAIGEVLYRTSDLVIDDRSWGAERLGRELALFFINPMRGINRLITGASFKRRVSNGRRFGVPPISMDISVGARMLALRENEEGVKAGAAAEVAIEYGDRYTGSTRAPYDYFSFLIEVQVIKSQPLLSRAEIIGRLLGREVLERSRLHVNVGIYQHFDFFDSDTVRDDRNKYFIPCVVPYKLGTPASVGGGVMARYIPTPSLTFDGYLHLNFVGLAGVLTDFYRDYHRNYNWGTGFSIKGGLNWALPDDRVSVKLANQFYHIYVWNGSDPDFYESSTSDGVPVVVHASALRSIFNHFEMSASYKLWWGLYLTAGLDLYSRVTDYQGKITVGGATFSSPIIRSRQLGVHLMMTYKF